MASSNNGFESINLASTILGPYQEEDTPIKRLHSIPASTSEDEDELDPEEFILNKVDKPTTKDSHVLYNKFLDKHISDEQLSHLLDNHKPNLVTTTTLIDSIKESELLYNTMDSLMIKSINFPAAMYQSNDNNSQSPIEYLSNRVKLLTQELYEDSVKYGKFLQSGNNHIYQLRSRILQTFDQLSESHYSLNELYNKDMSYAETLHGSFKKWDQQRNKVLSKVKSIKSDTSKHGAKLFTLLDEVNDVDDEIKFLEAKLQQLRSKKEILNKEIEDTSSVLESRTAKYVDIFKDLENKGRSAITDFLQSNGVPEKEIDTIVRFSPVDITISSNYSLKKEPKKEIHITKESIPQNESASKPANTPSIGMQPFIIPEAEANTKTPDLQSMNHDHGPTPFEKGYAMGTQNSTALKNKMNHIMKKFLDSLPTTPPSNISTIPATSRIKVDDLSNTISKRLDLDPIMVFLEHKVAALHDLAIKSSQNAALFHEFGRIWESVTKLMNSQEEKLESILKDDSNPKLVTRILNSTLEQLNSTLSALKNNPVTSGSPQDEVLISLITSEYNAIEQAVKLVSPDLRTIGELNSSGGLPPSSSKPTSQVYPISTSDTKLTTKME